VPPKASPAVRARPLYSQATTLFAVAATAFAKHMFQQPRSLEGVTGGSRRWCGVRRPRFRALHARGSGGTGSAPGALGPPPIRRTVDGYARRKCWKRAVTGVRPDADQRRAERRRALRSLRQNEGDAHAAGGLPARRALTTESASRRSAPSFAGGVKPASRRRKHDGPPRGRARPRTISRGCLTSESDENGRGDHLRRHARPCAGHPRLSKTLQARRGWPDQVRP